MKKLIKEYRKLLIILAIPYLFIVLSSIIKVNYDITTPAVISKVSSEITIGNSDICNVNTVSVYSYSKVSLLNYLLGLIHKNAQVEKTYEYQVTDTNQIYSSGVIQKRVSIYNAIISGYQAAGYQEIVDESSFKGYIIHTLYSYASEELQVGDIITKFEGKELKGLTGNNEFEVATENLLFEKDKKYQITVLRQVEETKNNYVTKELEFEISTEYYYNKENKKIASLGIATYEYVVPTKNQTIPSYSWQYGNSIGPSGGLMEALYVYDSLKSNTLTNGLRIVGTGTVDVYGNAGPIGGIYQKVIAAHLANADIFFVPVSSLEEEIYTKESNYLEALSSYQNLKNPKMKLVIVSSLNDIINYLENN